MSALKGGMCRCAVLLAFLTLSELRQGYGYGYGYNTDRCTIYQGGCAYHVVVTGSNCGAGAGGGTGGMLRDAASAAAAAASSYRSPRDSGHENRIDNLAAEDTDDDDDDEATKEDLTTQLKKMEELEKKLVKMMEGLSIRSLRHIRQIKTNLRKMTNSIDNLKMGKPGKAGKIECPNEFIGVGTWQSCYRFSTFNATWHEAREYCSAFGAELVSLDTMKEAYIVDYLIKSHPDYETPAAWWTSGNYIVRNHKWMWTTMHHLKPIRFSRWAPGEPDARSTMHCLQLSTPDKYQWRDAACTDKHNFVCEIEE